MAFIRYSEDYVAIEAEARTARAGEWQGEAEAPWDYRANRWERAAAESPRAGCPIKGNINRQGEKIYHTPWSPWYDRTVIDESKGQRWFCDEAEAELGPHSSSSRFSAGRSIVPPERPPSS